MGSKAFMKVLQQRYPGHNSCLEIVTSQWLWWLGMVCVRESNLVTEEKQTYHKRKTVKGQ